ncbi:hypothetical protein AAZX31_14G040600 [Glycine max]
MNIYNNILCWLLLPYFILLLLFLPSSSSVCNHHDSSALLLFKKLHNTTSKTETWKKGTDCCEWYGVRCDTISDQVSHVIGLDLSNSNLQGQLHSKSPIFSLRHLQQLNLSKNKFFGHIPSTISHLSKLLSLDLSDNYGYGYLRMRVDADTWNKLIQNATNLRELNLDGVDMPLIGDNSLSLLTNLSSSLISLSLFDTELQGNLSSDILSLPNLQKLDLSYNKDLRGELPKSNWSTPLSYLALSNTAFSGNIPDSIGHLKSLQTLDMGSCNFDGLVPSSLFNLTQLFLLDLSNNNLTGSIGEFSSSSLKFLFLENNKLQDNFSNSIFELQKLTGLTLSSTDLSGHLDFHQFSKLKHLAFLNLSHNSLLSINFDSTTDYILPNLVSLHLSSCNISSFLKFLAPLQNLIELDLSHNNISGSIPQWFYEKLLHSWNKIDFINLSSNKLQGDVPIPPNGIRYFLVSNNELTGNIPSAMCNASSLHILNLAQNNLTGPIPQCLGTFPSLLALDLQMNKLYGNIPWNFSKGNAFETIKLNGNQLDGPLPRSLANCTNLEVLDLADNNIEDAFPHWLESLQELQVLILRSNKFHGVITCFGTKNPFPKMRIFYVSNNNFSGPLPTSYIKNFQEMMNVNASQTHSIGLKNVSTTRNLYNDSVVIVMKGQSMNLVRILFAFMVIDLSNNVFEGELPKVIGEL